MPLDPYNMDSGEKDPGDRFNPEQTAKPEVIAVREDVLQTTVNNVQSSTSEKDYVRKARKYARKFEVMGVEDWLRDGRSEFSSEEELHEWASDLPWPHKDYYYNLST